LLADRVLTLFSAPLSRPVEEVASQFSTASRQREKLLRAYQAFRRLGGDRNLMALARKRAGLVLLDWPSAYEVKRKGLSYRNVMAVYGEALSVSGARLRKIAAVIIEFFQDKKQITITCPRGTNITFKLSSHRWLQENCYLPEERLVQLPGGEVWVPPDHTSAQGKLVAGMEGRLVEVIFRKGVAEQAFLIEGKARKRFSHRLVTGKERHCEFGVGTNPAAKPYPVGPIYEKALGTVHLGVGDSSFFGGPVKSDVHGDFVIIKPTVVADGQVLMRNGRFVWKRREIEEVARGKKKKGQSKI
jgi:hypothetical protein